MIKIESAIEAFANFMWGPFLLILLVFGGLFFTVYCRFIPFRYFKHGLDILFGKYDNDDDPGEINHFQALSAALAGTVGMGNISGVAVAIHMGGPGALFWMWVSAFVGMSTKFFTCTLAILFRGKDDLGELQGGPMYVIQEGLGQKFKPLAVLFSTAGLIGCLPMFQANQLTQFIRDSVFLPLGMFSSNPFMGNVVTGILIAILVAGVIFGGIKRIGLIAGRIVPLMVLIYLLGGLGILIKNYDKLGSVFNLIFSDAFTGNAVVGGVVGEVIRQGIRRAVFSNEAGLGTEVMAHGAAKTKEPVREGLVAMLGPFIDTILVCSITAFAILVSGVWNDPTLNGVSMTAKAFSQELGLVGDIILFFAVFSFSITTMFGQSYYGAKCTGFLFGSRWKSNYNWFYVLSTIIGATVSISIVINLIDGMYAIMAIPTMVSTILLAPKVMKETRRYFSTL
ncbi:MAG: alanine/glycine:cation symporter family protein [Fidelibacterota bacterium]